MASFDIYDFWILLVLFLLLSVVPVSNEYLIQYLTSNFYMSQFHQQSTYLHQNKVQFCTYKTNFYLYIKELRPLPNELSFKNRKTLPCPEKDSSSFSLIFFPCCANAVKARALYKPFLFRYPCLLSTASHIWKHRGTLKCCTHVYHMTRLVSSVI